MDVIERWEWELMVQRQRDVEMQRRAEQEDEAMLIREFEQEMQRIEEQERECQQREMARMHQNDEWAQEIIESEQEECERGDMDLEDHDVSDAVIWERNVRPRLELEKECSAS